MTGSILKPQGPQRPRVRDERIPEDEGPLPGAEVRQARVAVDDNDLHAPERPGDVGKGPAADVLRSN